MAYQLKSVTIRTNNTDEGMERINEIWKDILSGKLPVLFDSDGQFQQGISPVSKYSNYENDESGDYDLSIIGVTSSFFQEVEKAVGLGKYKKYEHAADDLGASAKMAWIQVWSEQQSGKIQRAFSEDYESTVPAEYTKDGKARCYLYIAIR